MTDDNKEVEMLDYRVYNNIIIIGFIFKVMQRLIVILSSVIVMGLWRIVRR